uniref:Uncharacterized protein n=1 Tax=viral metagenome TaxID=1070528 RepID=A0A6C0EEX6_9ZZZZ
MKFFIYIIMNKVINNNDLKLIFKNLISLNISQLKIICDKNK